MKSLMQWFSVGRKTAPKLKPLLGPAQAKLPVVRTLTLPNGEKIRVMRDDAFDRAIERRERTAA
ncbi:hypothetical protein [Azospirillum argentinense]|uniref:hypothetical protein n=1 Tax=Azospirillum argentinense TaxID=2970906 RepID=UPI0032E04E13